MEITKVITKYGKDFGVIISDDETEYPIILKSLYIPMILDELLNSGWELYDLPYDLRKGDITFENLPRIDFAAANISQDDEQMMLDQAVGLYKEIDLKAKMAKKPAQYLKFRPGISKIRTRDELLKFLETVSANKLDIDDPMTYMPLNALVADEALFTAEEFFAKENYKYIKAIEERRHLTLKSYGRLVKSLLQLGLKKDFNSIDLVNDYFSWGICGLKSRFFTRSMEDSMCLIGTRVTSLNEEDMLYIKEYHLTYMNTSGHVYYPANVSREASQVELIDSLKELRKREINKLGFEYVTPIKVSTRSSTKITMLVGENVTVQFDDNQLFIQSDIGQVDTYSLRINSLYSPKDTLPGKFFNIYDKSIAAQMFEDAFIRSQASLLIDRITVKVDVSSYQALQLAGAGKVGSIIRMFYNPGFGKESMGDIVGTKDFSGERMSMTDMGIRLAESLGTYLRGEMSSDHPLFEEMEDIVYNTKEGIFNIDGVADGDSLDHMESIDKIVEQLIVVHKYLDVPLNTMMTQIQSLIEDDKYIEFRGNDMALRINLQKRDNKLKGFVADVNLYKMDAAKEARVVQYVQEVYRELGGKANRKPRHVAAKILSFYKDGNGSKKIWDMVKSLFIQEIENNVKWNEQDAIKESIEKLTANGLFNICIRGELTFPKSISGRTLNIEAKTVEAIRSYMDDRFDSTIALAETAVTREGKFFRYTVNATITPEFVIPNANFVIPEKPFLPAWLNPSDFGANVMDAWTKKGFIKPGFRGYARNYKSLAVIDIPTFRDPEDIPMSVPAYYKYMLEFRDAYPNDREFIVFDHYLYQVYPKLKDDEDLLEEYGEKLVESVNGVHPWSLGDVVNLNREVLFARNPEVKNMFDTTPELGEGRERIAKFYSYSAEDFFHLQNIDNMHIVPDFGDSERALAVKGNKVYFKGDVYNVSELDSLDQEKYAILHLRGRKYLLEDIAGTLWEFEV